MVAQPPIRESEAANWEFFLGIPETDRKILSPSQVKDVQLLRPLFGILRRLLRLRRNPLREVDDAALRRPHVDRQRHRLLLHLRRQPAYHALLRERARPGADVVQLAVRKITRSSGLGMRLAVDKQNEYARELVWRLNAVIGDNLAQAILNADQKTEPGIFEQRERIKLLKRSWPAPVRRKRAT